MQILFHKLWTPARDDLLRTHFCDQRPLRKNATRIWVGQRIFSEQTRLVSSIRINQKLNVSVDRVAEPRRLMHDAQDVPHCIRERHTFHCSTGTHRVNDGLTKFPDNFNILAETRIFNRFSDEDCLERFVSRVYR